MSVDRITRVNEVIKRELSEIIRREAFSHDRSVLVSVTRVKTTVDLRKARVGISVFGGDVAEKQKIIAAIKQRRGHIQKQLSSTVVLKYTPVLEFFIDDTLAEGDRILEILSGDEDAHE